MMPRRLPHTLGRHFNCDAPKNTAATAGNRNPGPIELQSFRLTFARYEVPMLLEFTRQ